MTLGLRLRLMAAAPAATALYINNIYKEAQKISFKRNNDVVVVVVVVGRRFILLINIGRVKRCFQLGFLKIEKTFMLNSYSVRIPTTDSQIDASISTWLLMPQHLD